MRQYYWSRTTRLVTVALCFAIALVIASSVFGSPPAPDLARYALCDVRVLYIFDEPESIDWSILYYLNDEFGVRLDLVTFGVGTAYRKTVREIPDREIYMHTIFSDANDSTAIDSALSNLFVVRRPDIVIFGNISGNSQLEQLQRRFLDLAPDKQSLFNIVKIYSLADASTADSTPVASVSLNRRELLQRYRQRMELEVPLLFPWFRPNEAGGERLARYDLVKRQLPTSRHDPDFLSGLKTIRLASLIDSVLSQGAVRMAFKKRTGSFLSFFGVSLTTERQTRVRHLMSGLKELVILSHQAQSETDLTGISEFLPYLQRLVAKAQRAVLKEIGLDWEGRIILRDSPHGPKLKFRASLSVNGPQEIELSYIKFQPYWDSSVVVLDSISRKIPPHQSFVQEYLVDIERSRLEARMPESLVFISEIVYGNFPLVVSSTLPIWESPDLGVQFQPGFSFIQPFARLDVDKVVTTTNWKVVITKPKRYYGTVKLDLDVPRGIFAGAYRQEVLLEKGRTREMVRIPFSVSNLFEMGIQQQTLTLSVDGRPVVTDTSIIRIASCHIEDTVKIGFLPDTTGLLEDILRMTDADFRPLTDRSLLTGDLDAYNVIIVGSGALREYPSFHRIKGKLEQYLRHGGSLVIFGQPADWPQGVIPVSLIPAQEAILRTELQNNINEARILKRPHKINEDDLLAWFSKRRQVSAAVVSPAERVYVTSAGATLLSVSRIGDGQIIYCGLPIIEMISRLNLEAIHLFSNILNY